MAAKARNLTPATDPTSYGPMTMPSQIEVIREHARDDALERGGALSSADPNRSGKASSSRSMPTGVRRIQWRSWRRRSGPTLVVNPVRDMDEAVDRRPTPPTSAWLRRSLRQQGDDGTRRGATARRHGEHELRVMYAGVSALPWGGVGSPVSAGSTAPTAVRVRPPKSTVRERFALPVPLVSFARHLRTTEIVRRLTSVVHGR